jgi:hypothetical protein
VGCARACGEGVCEGEGVGVCEGVCEGEGEGVGVCEGEGEGVCEGECEGECVCVCVCWTGACTDDVRNHQDQVAEVAFVHRVRVLHRESDGCVCVTGARVCVPVEKSQMSTSNGS